jgi:hypothetical protein
MGTDLTMQAGKTLFAANITLPTGDAETSAGSFSLVATSDEDVSAYYENLTISNSSGGELITIRQAVGGSASITFGASSYVHAGDVSMGSTTTPHIVLSGEAINYWSDISGYMGGEYYSRVQVDQMMADLRAEMAATYALK